MRYSDLTDWITEQTAEPIVLPVRGRDFEFPGSLDDLPMAQALRIHEYSAALEEQRRLAQAGEPVDLTVIDDQRMLTYDDIVFGDQKEAIAEYCTAREYRHLVTTLLMHYMYGSEYARQAWDGTLQKAHNALGEDLGLTGNSSSTPKAPTGSTRTSTSTARRKGSARGARSKKPGTS